MFVFIYHLFMMPLFVCFVNIFTSLNAGQFPILMIGKIALAQRFPLQLINKIRPLVSR